MKIYSLFLDVTIVTVYVVPDWNVNALPSMNMLTDTRAFGAMGGPDQLVLAYARLAGSLT